MVRTPSSVQGKDVLIALLANTGREEYINQKDFYMLRAKTRTKNNVRLLRRKIYSFISPLKTTFIVKKY